MSDVASASQSDPVIQGNSSQQSINIVLERVPGIGCLDDTDYNNFNLRRKIYHHKICNVYQFFAPLIAVNLTKYPVTLIQNQEQADLNQTLLPHTNLYVNLTM